VVVVVVTSAVFTVWSRLTVLVVSIGTEVLAEAGEGVLEVSTGTIVSEELS
jgi:hypothetical protein